MSNVLRRIPSVHELLDSPPLQRLVRRVNRNVVVSGVRDFLDNLRGEVQSATREIHVPDATELAERIAEWILQEETPALRTVINATGVLLHTGLGRAPLAQEALEAIRDVGGGYASLEVDLESGQRSQRNQAVEKLLRQLTGAEAAAVVNNNAGATMLTLAAVAGEKEVIVSRGQLIEIGGSYRLPDVMSVSGVKLREVGTTNKTRIADFQQAIGPETGALMQVHTSNFVVVGFTESATLAELVSLGRQHELPVIDDIGSGALIDLERFGLQDEPVASQSIKAGADLVLFSGDKLLGGPQCGIIVGRRSLVQKIVRHPLMRALRVDKLTLAALAATLQLYHDPERALQHVPLLALLQVSPENLKHRAERLAPQLAACPLVKSAEVVESTAQLGGGSVPTQHIPTWCVALEPAGGSADELARRLRSATPAIFGRIQRDRLLIDLRTVFAHQDMLLAETVGELGPGEGPAADRSGPENPASSDPPELPAESASPSPVPPKDAKDS